MPSRAVRHSQHQGRRAQAAYEQAATPEAMEIVRLASTPNRHSEAPDKLTHRRDAIARPYATRTPHRQRRRRPDRLAHTPSQWALTNRRRCPLAPPTHNAPALRQNVPTASPPRQRSRRSRPRAWPRPSRSRGRLAPDARGGVQLARRSGVPAWYKPLWQRASTSTLEPRRSARRRPSCSAARTSSGRG